MRPNHEFLWLRWLVQMTKMARTSGSRVIVEDRLAYYTDLGKHLVASLERAVQEHEGETVTVKMVCRLADAARHRAAIRGILDRIDARTAVTTTDPLWITKTPGSH